MRRNRRATVALGVALLTCAPRLAAQTHRDVIRGTVTADSGAVASADVIVTMAPDRVSTATKTDAAGKYTFAFEHGTGDYLVHVSAPGYDTFRKRVTRSGTDSVFVVDVTLKRTSAGAAKLQTVTVTGQKPKPRREEYYIEPTTGAAEHVVGGVNGAVAPDQAGDLNALAGTVPGIAVTPGGYSVAGLPSSQNSTTLNGMAFGGADIPRDARTQTRVAASAYDPSRGWFSGGTADVSLSIGGVFATRDGHFTADIPGLRSTDPVARQTGQLPSNIQASLGGEGSVLDDRFAYNYGVQGGRRAADVRSLVTASPDLLARAGVAADSVAQLARFLTAAGIPMLAPGIAGSQTTQNVSFIGRVDHAPYNWGTFTPARTTYGLLAYAKLASNDATGIIPTATASRATHGGQQIGMLQALFSTYMHGDYLTDVRSGLTISHTRSDPYLTLPAGNVLVASTLADAPGGLTLLGFGGGGITSDSRKWTWETTAETQFYKSGRAAHRVKASLDSRFDGVRNSAVADPFGAFSFNSLADLATNTPTSFTRILNAPPATGGEWNGYAALGDYWRVSDRFQLLYGARLEANHFTSTPAYNPAVANAFGYRTDHAPNTVHVSPRAGFTWIRTGERGGITFNPIGTFTMGPTSYVRGGIGEFRSLTSPALLANAAAYTGLTTGARSLTCIGAAVPTPDWSSYLGNPGAIPNQCIGATTPAFSDVAPAVQLFDPSFATPRSWRANLSYQSGWHKLLYTLEGLYSINLDQPGRVDLNFANTPRFTLADEGRPVFTSLTGIVPSTGATSSVGARRVASFAHVIDNVSSLQSRSKQLTLTVAPDLNGRFSRFYASGSYTLASTRALASGFDGATFGSPLTREWARGDLDIRHQLLLQGGFMVKGLAFTLFGRFQSGLPFTPMIRGDVNGDGFSNDRAFIFDPSRAPDTALASATRALLASPSASVRGCLAHQLGRAAGRNSCEGPWTASLSTQVSYTPNLPRLGRRASVALAFENPLGGLDELIHGTNNLHGWGTAAAPDPVLYSVRGFDPATQRYRYTVNPRFGSTSPALSTLRAPFRVTLDLRIDMGVSMGQQQLSRWLMPGRDGHRGKRLTAAELKRRYERNVPDPYRGILEQSDSLLLTRDQVDSLTAAQRRHRQRMDSLWTDLSDYLAGLGDHFNSRAALARQESAIDSAWAMSRQDVQASLPRILSPVQLKLLPWPASMLYTSDPKQKIGVRMFMSG